ncbi:MAG: hypothetical protein AAB478_04215 [Patescibacteria group bacterium]
MNRRNLFSIVFSFVFTLSLFGSALADDPKVAPVVATPEQVTLTTKTLAEWATLVSDHDPAALDMMSKKAVKALFGTDDSATLVQYLAIKFETQIYPVDDGTVTVPSEGQFAATVSFRGFYTAMGYYTVKLRLVDNGGEFLTIDSAKLSSPVFPEGTKPTTIKLTIAPDVPAVLSTNGLDVSDFVVLSIVSTDVQTHVITLVKPGKSPLDPANWLGMAIINPEKKGKMGLAGLPAGTYDVIDSTMAADILVGQITVK